MAGSPRFPRVVPLALISIGLSVAARADTETHRRVTIRGTGSDISVERTETLTIPEKKPELTRGGPESSVLFEAIRMKQDGGSDDALLAYLRGRASQIPVVVDLESVNRLRRAGAGKSVLAYLASVAAIEIGDSGAVGGGPAAEPSPAPEPEYEGGYAAQYDYPVFGGYSVPSRSPRFRSFRRSEVWRFHAPLPLHRSPSSPMPAPRRPQTNRGLWRALPPR